MRLWRHASWLCLLAVGRGGPLRLLQDIVPGPGSSYPQDLLRAGAVIYFTAKDAEHGREIWALPVPRADGEAPAAGR